MAKAATALALGKNYRQDEALDWGLLTLPELTRRQRPALRRSRGRGKVDCDDPDPGDDGLSPVRCGRKITSAFRSLQTIRDLSHG